MIAISLHEFTVQLEDAGTNYQTRFILLATSRRDLVARLRVELSFEMREISSAYWRDDSCIVVSISSTLSHFRMESDREAATYTL